MPKPVPPPPPQPSVDDTARAVRFVYGVAVSAAAFFLLVASTYTPDNFFAQYGRGGASSWNVHKLAELDTEALRAHPGGKVVWLVGSSILRESFDEAVINADLGARGSDYRVAKFGLSRGTAGVVAGFIEQLPMRQGDVVVHNITNAHYHTDWIPWTGLPSERLMWTLSPGEFWHIPGWSLADKLEQASARPTNFWRSHGDVMRGLTEWIEAVWWWQVPEVESKSFHLTHRDWTEKTTYLERMRSEGIRAGLYLRPECCDYTDEQFNMRGLRRIEAITAAAGVDLEVVLLPARQEYDAVMVHRDAAAGFDLWLSELDNLSYAPRPFEDGFYDFKHPNRRGRKLLSRWVTDWLTDGRPQGYAPPLRWPIPDTNQLGVNPPADAGLAATVTADDSEDE